MERTFAIIKPDAVEAKAAGRILARIEEEGFRIVGLRMENLTVNEAEGFYAVHRERPFFNDLTAFMSSGPCVVMVLEADGGDEGFADGGALLGIGLGQKPAGDL